MEVKMTLLNNSTISARIKFQNNKIPIKILYIRSNTDEFYDDQNDFEDYSEYCIKSITFEQLKNLIKQNEYFYITHSNIDDFENGSKQTIYFKMINNTTDFSISSAYHYPRQQLKKKFNKIINDECKIIKNINRINELLKNITF